MAPQIDVLWKLAELVLREITGRWPVEDDALPARQYVTIGGDTAVVWDAEQLTVSINRTFGHIGDVGVENWTPTGVDVWWMRAAVVDITLIRKHPNLDAAATSPSPDALSAAARRIMLDAQGMLNCIIDAQKDSPDMLARAVAFESWTPQGPMSDLAGGTLRIRLGMI